ncbi:hypothetical protein BU25DRAFT_364158 [Macroventuria anomochaeta]|uniref:Uncharacterized protein n=1 Tax=Macroventuria anomochaeta TaxID=301207 RepID=A0ACB6S6C0_9PLEO|nr:uncharacterized protein BU25DRAFT_364158 [Macroventuria anomochaeta]KAF2629826.1 hypothetical protein BU25DRAFT_364158 [Macroventuria anomochaeta]
MGNKNRKQVHAYNPNEIERLRCVPLPAKLKCNMCLKNYNQANFSQKQLTDVRWQVSRSGRITTNPKCSKCTGGQLVEIECVMCHKTKGLEGYAKVQRKKPDDATCYDCMEIQVSREPVDEVRYEDPTKAFITTESSGGSYPDYWSSASSTRDTTSSAGDWEDTESTDGGRRRHEGGGIDLSEHFQHALSVSGEVSDTLIDSEFSYKPANDTKPGTWSEVAGTKSWHTGTETASSVRSGFDPNRYGRPGARSVSDSVHSFNSSIAERSQSDSGQVEMKGNFAKIKAYKAPPQDDPFNSDEEDEKESSSDDEADYSDDDTVI